MMKRLILCMAAAGLATWMPSHAAVDGLQAARSSEAVSLHWENIKGAPWWLSGNAPVAARQTRFPSGVYSVELGAGPGLAIHVPAHAMLRVVAEPGGPSEAPVFLVSNGSGLAAERTARPGSDGRSWLLATESDDPAVIHLQRAGKADTPQRLALFLAHFEAPQDVVTYRHELQLDGPRVRVRQANETSAKRFVRLSAEQELKVQVRGPDRLLLEYRLDGMAPAGAALVAMDLAFDDEPARQLRQVVGAGARVPVSIDSEWQAAGASERVTLEIPAGEHMLRLRTSHGVLLRAALQGRHDFLLPDPNMPWRETSADAALEAAEQESIAGGMSNRWRNAGALAAGSLRAEAAKRPGQEALRRAASELDAAFLRYRDLVPEGEAEAQVRSIVLPQPRDPDGKPRHRVTGKEAAFAPLPKAVFHMLGEQGLGFALPQLPHPVRVRALVPADAGRVELEVELDDGRRARLMSGMPALPQEAVDAAGSALALVPKDAWPASLSGHADRGASVAPALRVASVEWMLPAHVRTLRIHVPEGSKAGLPLALQWEGSAEYAADDVLLAQLVRDPQAAASGKPLYQAALQPLERRLAAAHAQLVANVVPASKAKLLAGTDAEAILQVAERESDPAHALGLWQQALGAEDESTRARALHGLAEVLFAAGERHIAESILRSYWAGEDAALAQAAARQLESLYAREGDRSMQILFAAAQSSKEPAHLPRLSALLAADGSDDTALLAGLAGLVGAERDTPALLQSALRARKWATFDALLATLTSEREREFWRAQRALSLGELDAAAAHFNASGEAQWQTALAEGRVIAERMLAHGGDPAGAVGQWLQWQAQHPGPRVWREETASLVRHAGAASVRSVTLDTRRIGWKATARQPVLARIVGPARIRIEARPMHGEDDSRLDGWLQVRTEDQLWLQPFHQNQPAPGLLIEQGQQRPGSAVVREIDLPAGLHSLSIHGGPLDLLTRIEVERPALQLPVLPAPMPAHFDARPQLRAMLAPSAGCHFNGGCHIVADGSLQGHALGFDTMRWEGLPAPKAEQDAAAAHLASGDIEGALAATTEPAERMRLLLWLAGSRPEARAMALAQGAEIARNNPDREIRAQWNQLSADASWSPLPLVDRSAGLRRVETPAGAPESPAARIRAALLPALREGETRIGAGTRAGMLLNEPAATPLALEIAAEALPGEIVLPTQVIVERNGRQIETIELRDDQPVTRKLKLPAGEQHVTLSMPKAYAGQSLRVRFRGPRPAQPHVTRDWQIATAQQPVQATLAGPVWVRIDRLEQGRVHSEERLLPEAVSRLELPVRDGAKETLYRVHQLRAHPQPAEPAPARPTHYEAQPMPEAPDVWLQQGAMQPDEPQPVHFVDAVPLGGELGGTLSGRLSLQSRRDVEAVGGRGLPVPERYAEAGLTWRTRSTDESRHQLADVFVRDPEFGSPVLGFRLRAEQDVPWTTVFPWPFTISASLRGLAQDTPAGMGTSLSGTLALSQRYALSSTLSHRPEISIMGRTMNLSRVADARTVDTEVFSDYRMRHKRALTLSDTISWRPWRDTHVLAGISVTTNPDFNLSRVDNHQASLTWRQLIGPLIVEAGARAIRYWSDADRRLASLRKELHLGAAADVWAGQGSRIEVAGALRRDLETAETWGGIELRWHWGPGRGLRDFSSTEHDFGAIRSWGAPATRNRMENE